MRCFIMKLTNMVHRAHNAISRSEQRRQGFVRRVALGRMILRLMHGHWCNVDQRLSRIEERKTARSILLSRPFCMGVGCYPITSNPQ